MNANRHEYGGQERDLKVASGCLAIVALKRAEARAPFASIDFDSCSFVSIRGSNFFSQLSTIN